MSHNNRKHGCSKPGRQANNCYLTSTGRSQIHQLSHCSEAGHVHLLEQPAGSHGAAVQVPQDALAYCGGIHPQHGFITQVSTAEVELQVTLHVSF